MNPESGKQNKKLSEVEHLEENLLKTQNNSYNIKKEALGPNTKR